LCSQRRFNIDQCPGDFSIAIAPGAQCARPDIQRKLSSLAVLLTRTSTRENSPYTWLPRAQKIATAPDSSAAGRWPAG
jgi:hypothetical protein